VAYSVVVLDAALKQLRQVPKADRTRIRARIDALAEDPRPAGAKKLRARENLWRIRSGDYRIIYSIKDERLLVLVIRIGHRREVYR